MAEVVKTGPARRRAALGARRRRARPPLRRVQGRASACATRTSAASGPCSTSATRSRTRSRRRPATTLPHGEAVALGLLAALRLSGLDTARRRGGARARSRCASTATRAWAALPRDKKARRRRVRLVLLEAPGKPRDRRRAARRRRPRGARRADRDRVARVRVVVLNGVNLDVLGRRDPGSTAGSASTELETRIYEWAQRARAARPLPPDEPRGRVRRLVPRRARLGRRRDRQPRRLDALQLRDPRRARAVRRCRSSRCTSRTSTSARSGGAHSVIADLAATRVIGKGPDGLPRGARVPRGAARVNDADRAAARASLEEPLLVTNRRQRPLPRPASQSSNAALLVEPERVAALHRLPLRARRRARVEGVEVVETKRAGLRGPRRARLGAGSASRPTRSRYAQYETLARGRRSSSCRGAGSSRRCARSRTSDELDAIRARRARSPSEALRAARRGAVRRPHRARARLAARASSSTSSAPTELAFDDDRRRRPERRARRTRDPGDARRSSRARLVVVDAGACVDGYCSDCTRTFATGAARRASCARRTTSASRRSSPALDGVARRA